MFDPEVIRKDFPILSEKIHNRNLIYLDNAATTQMPIRVQKELSAFYGRYNSNVHRGVHYLSEQATERYESARQITAEFIGANPEEVIFTSGTTASVNMLAGCLEDSMLSQGDEVIVTKMEHHSNYLPWLEVCKRTGAVFKTVNVTDNGDLDLGQLRELLNEKTKIVCVTAVSNVTGTVNPVKEIAAMAHSAGALVLVDAAQAMRHMQIDVREMDCDFLCFSGHKMMAPVGIGVLYGKKGLLEELPPSVFGGGMVDEVHGCCAAYGDIPHKFEAGTPNYAGAIGLAAAIRYLRDLGISDIYEYERRLLLAYEDMLSEFDDIRILGNPKERAGAISLHVPGTSAFDMAAVLDKFGIAVRSGSHCAQPLLESMGVENVLRISPAFYNTFEEISCVKEALKKTLSMI